MGQGSAELGRPLLQQCVDRYGILGLDRALRPFRERLELRPVCSFWKDVALWQRWTCG